MSSENPQPLSLTIRLLLALGLVLSLVLEYVHATTYLKPAMDSFCAVGQTFDCGAVAASKYSVVLGVPWAVWGAVGFLTMLIAGWQRSVWLLPLALFSAAVSLALLVLSLTAIGSLCYLCEAVHLVSWVLAFFVVRQRSSLQGSLTALDHTTSIFAVPVGLSLALVLFMPGYWNAFTFKSDVPYAHGTTDDGHPWIGAEQPEITIEEYVDYTCPHCKALSTRTLKNLAKHPELRIVRRQQPRMRCKAVSADSCIYVRFAQCAADQGKFWQADRWLFTFADVKNPPKPEKLAHDLELDSAKFSACVTSEAAFSRANDEYRKSVRGGIRFTPGYKVDGKRVEADVAQALLD